MINSINYPRIKHIDASYHQVRKKVVEIGELKIEYI